MVSCIKQTSFRLNEIDFARLKNKIGNTKHLLLVAKAQSCCFSCSFILRCVLDNPIGKQNENIGIGTHIAPVYGVVLPRVRN